MSNHQIFVLILFILFIFFLRTDIEYYTNNLNITNQYDKFIDNSPQKPQIYLDFLSDLNQNMKSKAPITGAFRGSCDDKVNQQFQNQALYESYSKLNKDNLSEKFKRDPCIAYANYLCEFTDPALYLSENQYFPPRWLTKTYKDQRMPYYTNISCFNSNYNCCKQSKLS